MFQMLLTLTPQNLPRRLSEDVGAPELRDWYTNMLTSDKRATSANRKIRIRAFEHREAR